jgi:glycosyltransferase involved in cell wall biosynthesis
VPSLTFETFGIIIIEAFARKTPVIVRDLGALPEVVEDSGGGFVFRTDEELLQAIQQLTSSPQLRAELGQKGYETFVRLWSREAHLQQYYALIDRLSRARRERAAQGRHAS